MCLLLLLLQYIVIVVFYESNLVAFQGDSIMIIHLFQLWFNFSPVQCGWVHPVKKHSQQLLVGHLKERTKTIYLFQQHFPNQVGVEEHLDGLSVTSGPRANLFAMNLREDWVRMNIP